MEFVQLINRTFCQVREIYHVLKYCQGKWMAELQVISRNGVAMQSIVTAKADVFKVTIYPIKTSEKRKQAKKQSVTAAIKTGNESFGSQTSEE